MSRQSTVFQTAESQEQGVGQEFNRLLREGRSLSGGERHCLYLNTGRDPAAKGKFADVSAVTQLDLPDDGRGVSVSDWDLDGDLDFWVANRSAPQLRFLRNDLKTKNHFLALKLLGTTCNRDAIGARLELFVREAGKNKPSKLIRTHRAGDGYLSQSSKWLHFGIPPKARIDRLVIRWPGGEVETVQGLESNHRYQIVQGRAQASPWSPPSREVRLVDEPIAPIPPENSLRILLPSSIRIPELSYQDFDGTTRSVPSGSKNKLLLTLWSTWCAPCRLELESFAKAGAQLQDHNIDLLTLSIDTLAETPGVDEKEVQEYLHGIGFTERAGYATSDLVGQLQVVLNSLFDRHLPLVVPTSLLLDESGELCAIYRGPVEVDQLLTDAKSLALPSNRMRAATVFPGKRYKRPPSGSEERMICAGLMEDGFVSGAADYYLAARPADFQGSGTALIFELGTMLLKEKDYARAAKLYAHALQADPNNPGLLYAAGFAAQRMKRWAQAEQLYRSSIKAQPRNSSAHFQIAQHYHGTGNLGVAIRHYREVLSADGNHRLAQNNLAWILATSSEASLRNGQEALKWARQVAIATKYTDPSVLDTLSVALAEVGNFQEAIEVATKGLQLAVSGERKTLAAEFQKRLAAFRKGSPWRD